MSSVRFLAVGCVVLLSCEGSVGAIDGGSGGGSSAVDGGSTGGSSAGGGAFGGGDTSIGGGSAMGGGNSTGGGAGTGGGAVTGGGTSSGGGTVVGGGTSTGGGTSAGGGSVSTGGNSATGGSGTSVPDFFIDATNGSDANNGTSDTTAWKTIAKLNSASLSPGKVVGFKRGETFFGPLLITSSGTSGNPIRYEAYGTGANPVLTGGVAVTAWTSAGTNVYQAPLAAEPKVVTLGEQQLAPGRFPDTGYLRIDSTSGSDITSTGLAGQPNLVGAKVVTRKNRFIIEKETIASHSGNTIGISNVSYNVQQGYGFFITGSVSTLNQPGEWFYDSAAHVLKMYSTSGPPVGVTASTVVELVPIFNQTDITFTDLEFNRADDLFRIEDVERITFERCTFRLAGVRGLSAGGSFNRHVSVTHSRFSDINSDGMQLYSSGNSDLVIQHNTFDRMGMLPGEGDTNTYRAISLESASPNVDISDNVIDTTGYVGISGSGNPLVISNNVITNFCKLMDDGGGVYLQEANGRTKRVTGNLIFNGGIGAEIGTDDGLPQHNQAMGIYSDATNAYAEFDNNVIWNTSYGIYVDDSHDLNIHDNLLFANDTGVAIDGLGHADVAAIQFNHNIVVSPSSDATLLSLQKQGGSGPNVSTWGSGDNNIYARPLNDTDTLRINDTGASAQQYTLTQWQANSTWDAHSHASPIALTSAAKIRFEYNDTMVNRAVALGANTYVSTDGTAMTGTLMLQPFTGAVLLQTN